MPMEKVEISVTTSSQVMQFHSLPPAQPPQITMNGRPVGQIPQHPYRPSGWQVLILDPTKDIKTPGAVLSNQYILLQPGSNTNFWMSTYQYMYSGMVRQFLNSGNYEQQLVIVASFGLDANVPPTNDALRLLLDFGAGAQLQNWETHVDVGSQVDNNNSWVSFPANYLFIGSSSLGYGQAYEKFEKASGPSIQSTLTGTVSNFVPAEETG